MLGKLMGIGAIQITQAMPKMKHMISSQRCWNLRTRNQGPGMFTTANAVITVKFGQPQRRMRCVMWTLRVIPS